MKAGIVVLVSCTLIACGTGGEQPSSSDTVGIQAPSSSPAIVGEESAPAASDSATGNNASTATSGQSGKNGTGKKAAATTSAPRSTGSPTEKIPTERDSAYGPKLIIGEDGKAHPIKRDSLK